MNSLARRAAMWHTIYVRRKVTMRELAEQYQVDVRTIRRDIDILSLDHPIVTIRGRYGGGVALAEDAITPKQTLTEEQVACLLRASEAASEPDATILRGIIQELTTRP